MIMKRVLYLLIMASGLLVACKGTDGYIVNGTVDGDGWRESVRYPFC